MKILGIETSCDETSAAIIDGENILAEVVFTQSIHSLFGGVVPELASRDHIRKLYPTVRHAFSLSGLTPQQIDAIAVSEKPGLPGATLVGISFASGFSCAAKVPAIWVDHLEGHIFTAGFAAGAKPPFLALLVSGGHTELILVERWGEYELLGTTRDDAAGEAFDKVAQILGLPYPGGPAIQKSSENGDPDAFHFPRAMQRSGDLDFSFSGLKTAAMNLINAIGASEAREKIADIAASFQEAVVDTLLIKVALATNLVGIKQVAIIGGVAANLRLREKASEMGWDLKIPPPKYCTDNATMIAMAGHFHIDNGNFRSSEMKSIKKSQPKGSCKYP